MENEIKVILDNIEKLQGEIKELIMETSLENKRFNDELSNLIKGVGEVI